MSLYWQQAVQNKKPQPAAQSHVATGNNPAETWQNVNLGQPQNNYWSHDQANQVPQNYQQSSQPAQTNNYNQSYQHVPPPSAYSLPPPVQHIPLLNSNQTQHVPQEVQYQGYVGQDGQYYQNYDYYHTGYNAAQQEQQYYLPQVASLSSIPEFESVDFPTATAASPAVEFAPAQPQSVQEHPVVSLPAEQVDHPAKQSSQVTPESTYSVDTFNSNHSKEEKKEDEWDDWEQTPRESVHEKSPYAMESTQSEPIPSVHSDPSRESTFSLEHQAAHEAEKHVEVQPVAQVAPIIKNHPEPEHPVARVGPVSQIPVEPNVRRVAPTRPIQAAVPLPEPVVEIRPEFVTTAQSTSSQSTAAPPEVSPVLASAVTEERPRLSPRPEDRSHLVAPEVEEPRTTPDTLQLEHIGQAQATSTPNDSVQEVERVVERRTSVSSIRSGIQPIATSGQVQNGEHSDSTQGSVAFSRGGVRSSYQERYRGVREKYIDVRTAAAESMHRLDRSRVDTPKLVRGNPLTEAAGGRRSVIQISSRNKADISNSSYTAHDKGNMSNFSQPDPSLNESMDISTHGGAGYGEDFVDASRRSRLNRNRPPSRAKSDIVDDMPYHHRGYSNQHHHHHGRHAYDNRGYPVHPQYYPYQQMARLSGRQSTGGMQYPNEYYQQQAMMYQHPRPQSTYDARSIERFQRNGGNMVPYDVYASRPEDEEDESFSEESDVVDEEGESEDEMRNYNMPAIPRGINNSFSSYPMASHARAPIFGPDEIYNLGLINLELKVAESVFRKFRVPREFASLEPEEKVAYLFFAVVYNKLSPVGVQGFRNMFKREYYNFICNGDTKDNALRKICNSMKEEYMAKNIQRQQKAYEASQKQLFSDDRDSADGLSDRASVYEKDDDRASDILSIDQRAPQKFRTPHAFLKFGPGGKKITVIPDNSVSVVYIDDVKTLLRDNHSRRLVDAAQNFKGPLLNDRTPSHSVLLYIQNQIMRIQHSDLAKSNPHSCDVVDCTLLWRLLETCVKQQGRVTGPDIAQLLIAVGPSSSRKALSNHREKSATPSQESIRTIQPDQKAYEMFTAYLLGGHVDEAVDWAVKSGLHADAMILVRRIFAGNEKKLADIEAKFLATRPTSNPVMTLVAVASGQPAPVLTNPPNDEEGSWRSHAAIVLANLNTSHAKETVYRLGCVLAKREYHAAADFCFLAVSLLSNFEGVNVFQRPTSTEEDADSRQYVSLIHASLPDDEWDSTTCRFGFSLTDLHATEIFDYAIKMTAPAGFVSPLNNSVEFQQKRLQYAQLLAGFGSFNAEAFRYLLSVVTSIWYYYHLFSVTDLTVLADLADSLRMYAADDAADTTWIENLRMMIINLQQKQNDQGPVSQPENAHQQTVPVVFQEQIQPEPVYQQQYQEPEPNPMSSRSRTDSLAIEARDWHAERQEPIQMSPRGSTASPSSFHRDSIAPQNDVMSPLLTEFQTPRGRMDSISSQQGQPMSYGEQLCQTQQQLYGQANNHQHNDYESATTESVDTTSPESSPIRSQPTTSSISAAEWHPTPEPPKSQPPSVMQQSVSAQQPRQQQTQAPTSSKPQENGGMKKSGSKSTGWMGSFVNKVRSVVPGSDDMRLPDDSNPSIVWDAAQNKWVGAGIEEQPAVAPPPAAMSLATAAAPEAPPAGGVAGGLRHARGGGASRYVATGGMGGANVGAAPVNVVPQQAPPAMPLFNFIPMMPDDADAVDPFSGASNPTVHGADQEQPQ